MRSTPIPKTGMYAHVFMANKEREDKEKVILTMSELFADVCNAISISPEKLRAKSRKRELVIGRSIFFSVARQLTASTISEIGKFMDFDHTTVIHALNSVKSWRESKDLAFSDAWHIYVTNSKIWFKYS